MQLHRLLCKLVSLPEYNTCLSCVYQFPWLEVGTEYTNLHPINLVKKDRPELCSSCQFFYQNKFGLSLCYFLYALTSSSPQQHIFSLLLHILKYWRDPVTALNFILSGNSWKDKQAGFQVLLWRTIYCDFWCITWWEICGSNAAETAWQRHPHLSSRVAYHSNSPKIKIQWMAVSSFC